MTKKPASVLLLGSGALKIGEAGEFDYSGSQAIKALQEEGIRTVLVNPNIATIQTSENFADEVYFLPVNPEFVSRIIEKEQVEAIMLAFGGQTALNCGLSLADTGVLARHRVAVLGTPIAAIRDTEDRALFNRRLAEIGVKSARSRACVSAAEVREAAREIGFPVMLRGAFALGGLGSAIVGNEDELEQALSLIFSQVSQVLVEESLAGWKEIEYEVVADAYGNCITVCNMENLDPLGVHTGESIVVAPSQTLNNFEYQKLRDIARRTILHLGIVGECNIQYALDPDSEDYRVIEVNARLSRSSALASKATGYPLAYVAAKLALGYNLIDLPNKITGTTRAYFEPALDYCVVKVPRWDLEKFAGVEKLIGSSMKSVGEVMAIARDFPAALQKALRMVGIGVAGLESDKIPEGDLKQAISRANPYRVFAIAAALRRGLSLQQVYNWSRIDKWFLAQIQHIVEFEEEISRTPWPFQAETLRCWKKAGFSDCRIAGLAGRSEEEIRELRRELAVFPIRRQIDTLAAEFAARTNYLYLTYDSQEDEALCADQPRLLILGSGVYRIGSSVEFDWCCVNTVQAARELGYETILLNHNPETVSTDFDVCDRLIFDEISLETVIDLFRLENPVGVVLSMGGQSPNNLAVKLARAGFPIIGTAAESIDQAEDRHRFSSLCDRLQIDQPAWAEYTGREDLAVIEEKIGFPMLVRPSYVLSGAAMSVARDLETLRNYLQRAALVSPDHPVVISRYETGSKEIEIDAVADEGRIIVWAISEHIENAGVHSGDATLVLPPQKLYLETVRRIKLIARRLAAALQISGPFNIQFLARDNHIKVIECNLRASRSFPFVSKVTGINFIRLATRIMLGVKDDQVVNRTLDLDYVAVKAAQFSFRRLSGADPLLGVEMASTGEVACFGDNLSEALLKALMSTGFHRPQKGVLLAIGTSHDKEEFIEYGRALADMGLPLFATAGTAARLQAGGITCSVVHKYSENRSPSTVDIIREGLVDLVINIPEAYHASEELDGYQIRRRAIDHGVFLVTNLQLAKALVGSLQSVSDDQLQIKSWREYSNS